MGHYHLIIVGGGSGGLGAALTAAYEGIQVLLIEQSQLLGGTITHCGGNLWYGGSGATGWPFRIYCLLLQGHQEVGILKSHKESVNEIGANFSIIKRCHDRSLRYLDTLTPRHKIEELLEPAIIFEPRAFNKRLREYLTLSQHCTLLHGQSFLEIEGNKRKRVQAIQLEDGSIHTADFWIDATDGRLCVANEWAYIRGREPRAMYGEPSAPEGNEVFLSPSDVTLIFRIRRKAKSEIDPLPSDISESIWWTNQLPGMEISEYPNGDWLCRMEWTMRGDEYIRTPPALAYQECYRRVRNYWYHIQKHCPEYQNYSICWFASSLEIRDLIRVKTQTILKEQDLQIPADQRSDAIAVCDYPGQEPVIFGIPKGSLLPEGSENVLIASRSSGFSWIASRYLQSQRTLMQLGQAAGAWIIVAIKNKIRNLSEVKDEDIRAFLQQHHVQLQGSLEGSLKDYIEKTEEKYLSSISSDQP